MKLMCMIFGHKFSLGSRFLARYSGSYICTRCWQDVVLISSNKNGHDCLVDKYGRVYFTNDGGVK